MITYNEVRRTMRAYLYDYPEETAKLLPIRALLDDGVDVTNRREYRGHVTAGAVLVNRRGEVLHVHHVELDALLFPGGHLEFADESLRHAALRELVEETGIDAAEIASVGIGPVQIDVHTIPASERKHEPEHLHFDFRYLFATAADVGELLADEVSSAAWRPIADMADPVLSRRVKSFDAAASAPGMTGGQS